MNKTIIDAVNEFKGEWKHKDTDMRTDAIYFRNKVRGSYYYYGDDMPFHHEFVCNKKQFNDLVSQMKTNFGKSHCYDVYKDAYKSICFKKPKSTKELEVMDIDWSKAPEGATHYNPSSFVELCKYYKLSGNEYVYYYNGRWESSGASRKALDECLIERPQPTLTYTQAMADNKVLPPIGSKVRFVGNDDYLVEFSIVDGDEIECICHTTDFDGESIGVYRHKDGYSVSILTQLVKPITPPIELIHGEAYNFIDSEDNNTNGIYSEDEHSFQSLSVEWLADHCTNIQPLTVEE